MIDVTNETEAAVDVDRIAALGAHVLASLRVSPEAELAVLFVDERAMADLNARWMDEKGPTDVLSFPMDELRPGTDDAPTPPGLLGDVVVCPDVAARQAREAGHGVADEIDVLVVHGILHLLGYDHAEPEEERAMFRLQGEILRAFRPRPSAR